MTVRFTVMTWNLENLFPAGAESGPATTQAYEQKLASLAQIILQLAPDVLAVQEVGGQEPFEDLQRALNHQFPHRQLSVHPDSRGIRVGFLSRLPIEASEDIAAFPDGALAPVPGIDSRGNAVAVTQMGRGALRIVVRPSPDVPVHLLTAHLKSKLLTFPSPSGRPSFSPSDEHERARVAGLALLKRAAEAVALRVAANALLEHDDHHALIVLGDLNDVPDAATTQLLGGPPGSEIGTPGFTRPDRGDDTRLFNLAPLIAAERRFSRVYRGQGELIDHIFASQELFPGSPRRVPRVDSHVDLLGGIPSIDDDPNRRRDEPQSDHAPVTATFEL